MPDDAVSLASTVLRAIRDRNGLDTALVDDVILECVEATGEQGGDIAIGGSAHGIRGNRGGA